MWSPEDSRCRPGVTLLACVLCAATAQGHAISVTRGSLVVHADRVQVVLRVSGHELLHAITRDEAQPATISREQRAYGLQAYRESLRDALIIRDQDGQRLTPRGPVCEIDIPESSAYPVTAIQQAEFTCELNYGLADATDVLVLQQQPRGRHAGQASQLVLAASGAQSKTPRVMQLTTRGNVHVLQLDWSDDRIATVRDPAAFERVTATLDMTGDEPSLCVRMPLAVLATWTPMHTGEQGQITKPELTRAAREARRLLLENAVLRAGGEPVQPLRPSVRFAPITGASSPEAIPEACCLWTTWVDLQVRYAVAPSAADCEFHWGLFNAAVLNAEVVVRESSETIHAELSTYQPAVRWTR